MKHADFADLADYFVIRILQASRSSVPSLNLQYKPYRHCGFSFTSLLTLRDTLRNLRVTLRETIHVIPPPTQLCVPQQLSPFAILRETSAKLCEKSSTHFHRPHSSVYLIRCSFAEASAQAFADSPFWIIILREPLW